MTTSPVSSNSVRVDALKLVADVAGAAELHGDTAGAAALRAEVDRMTGGAATVVVVGEKKRGKSSLINALIGQPGLLPTDVDLATNVHLAVQYGETPAARVLSLEHPEGRPVALEGLAQYAALDPETGTAVHADVLQVEVALPAELLHDGLCIVDTPGVGGLVAGHAAITLATLSRADALLFVVSAASELTASECQFLTRAAARIATVVFVVAQTDKHPYWERVLSRSQELIREHAPRYAGAPWFAVSSRTAADAVRACAAGDTERAEGLYASSGFAPLVELLSSRIAGRANRIRLRNTVFVAGQVVRRQLDTLRRRERSLADDARVPEELAGLRTRLREAEDHRSRWQSVLAERSKALERNLRLQLKRQLTTLREQFTDLIRAGDRTVLDRLPDELAVSVHAVWLDQETLLRTELVGIAAELVELAELTDDGAPSLSLAFPDALRELPEPTQTRSEGLAGATDRIIPSIGAGSFAASVAGSVGAALLGGGLASVFVPAAAGVAAVVFLYERRRRHDEVNRARQDATRYVTRILGRIDTELPPAVQETMDQALNRIRTLVIDGLAARRAELTAAIAEHERLRTAAAGERRQLRERTATALALFQRFDERLKTLDRELGDPS
jgi:hypothetical protein